jgi:membrane fusion protein (multidrug efflux system)
MPAWLEGPRRWILLGVVIAIAVGAFLLWRYLSPRESTDDAQVSGHVSPVAARVSGTVMDVKVHDNQTVRPGDVLVQIDSHDYDIAVQRAEADLSAAEATARAARSGVPITSATSSSELRMAEAGTSSAEAAEQAAEREVEASQAKLEAANARLTESTANATKAAQDLERMRPLVAKDEVSKQQYDAAVATDQGARAAVDSARAAVTEARANISVAEARHTQAKNARTQAEAQAKAAGTAPHQVAATEARAQGADAGVLQAKAALDQAKINLERTTIRAPVGGVVSRKTVEIGQVVQIGQALLALTSLDEVWVTANFKETQLRGMQPGQRADVSVDTYGGRTYEGRVESIAAATGATFSLLPADNASGNFVKVVQRVPVKIILSDRQDTAALLRPGMSANVTVFLK